MKDMPMRFFLVTFRGQAGFMVSHMIVAARDKHDALHMAMQEPRLPDAAIEVELLLPEGEPRVVLRLAARGNFVVKDQDDEPPIR